MERKIDQILTFHHSINTREHFSTSEHRKCICPEMLGLQRNRFSNDKHQQYRQSIDMITVLIASRFIRRIERQRHNSNQLVNL